MTLIDASTPCCNCNDRLQWRQELQRERERHGSNTNRHAHTQTLPPLDAAPAPPPHPGGLPIQAEGKAGPSSSTASDPASQHRQSDRDREASPSASSSVKPADGPSDENGAGAGAGDGDLTPTSSATAVELYAAAVTFEREGRLNEALRAYRSAFRKNDTVDKLYHKQQVRAEAAAAAAAAATGSGAAATTIAGSQNSTEPATDSLAFSFQRTLQLEPDYERQKGQLKAKMLTASYVDKLLASFAENPYIPEAERKSQQEPQSPAGQQDDIGEQATPEDGTDATTTAAGTDTALGKAKAKAKDAARHTLVFHPRNDSKPLHMAKLPDELLVHILSFLTALSPHARSPDMRSLERGFSLVSRKARILTLDSAAALWKLACLAVYTAPLLLDPATTASRVAAQAYGADWRLMWIEQPRVRTDGVYISQITYVRRGAPDSIGTSFAYNDITHMVTYYRYLCFLPTGDVVSLLSHDIPAVVVPNLLASHRHRAAAASASSSSPSPGRHRHGQAAAPAPSAGLSVGKWRTRHLPPTSTSPAPSMLVELTSLEDPRITSPSELKHSFTMTCRCKSTARGKNNKLEMLSLVALNHRTGEEGEIPIKSGTAGNQMPSFYFSRVLSYD